MKPSGVAGMLRQCIQDKEETNMIMKRNSVRMRMWCVREKKDEGLLVTDVVIDVVVWLDGSLYECLPLLPK
ncbi:hypothetical protein C5167_042115, partial [Papaver somniferum]